MTNKSLWFLYILSKATYSAFMIYILSVCVIPWELNPQPFALLTQCSTTEPQEHMTSTTIKLPTTLLVLFIKHTSLKVWGRIVCTDINTMKPYKELVFFAYKCLQTLVNWSILSETLRWVYFENRGNNWAMYWKSHHLWLIFLFSRLSFSRSLSCWHATMSCGICPQQSFPSCLPTTSLKPFICPCTVYYVRAELVPI